MALRQVEGDQHVPRFSDLFVITCDYGLQDINTVLIDRTFGFWQECRSTINYRTCLGDDHKGPLRSLEWRAS